MDRKKREVLESVPNPKNDEPADAKTIHLHEEIIFHILKRLSPKSLLRFKSVSKGLFNRIITSKPFIDAYSSSSRPGFLITWCSSFHTYTFSFLDPDEWSCVPLTIVNNISEVSQSLNGFLFLERDDDRCLVYNPTTREFKDFARPILPGDSEQRPLLEYFFGFDPSLQKYKVLAYGYGKLNEGLQYFVVTLSRETNIWRKLDQTTDPPMRYCTHHSYYLCIDGTIYFQNANGITGFDLSNEKFRHITQLTEFSGYGSLMMFQFGQNLGLLQTKRINKGRTMRIKIRKVEDNKTDIPTCVDSQYKLNLPFSYRTRDICEIVVHPQREEELLLFFMNKNERLLRDNKAIISCDLKTNSCEFIRVDGWPTYPVGFMVKSYLPTIASPKDL